MHEGDHDWYGRMAKKASQLLNHPLHRIRIVGGPHDGQEMELTKLPHVFSVPITKPLNPFIISDDPHEYFPQGTRADYTRGEPCESGTGPVAVLYHHVRTV